jgi:hypothetical protein
MIIPSQSTGVAPVVDALRHQKAAGQILPQLRETHCHNNPGNVCEYVCCTVDTDWNPYGVPKITCTTDWVCGHRRPDAGLRMY